MSMDAPLWTPTSARIAASILARFMEHLARAGHGVFDDYDALWQWSVTQRCAFWSAVRDFCALEADWGDTVLTEGAGLPDARFFPDTTLNYAQNLLSRDGDDPALIAYDETGRRRVWSWTVLRGAVASLQQRLRGLGVGPGARVAGLVPNAPETVAAMLATTSLGAIWTSCSPDFGAPGVIDRFGQIDPTVLIVADACHYGGKRHADSARIAQIAQGLPSLAAVLVFSTEAGAPDIRGMGDKASPIGDLSAPCAQAGPEFTHVNFNDPLYLMYSSGTTGLPKCIMHSVGGTLLQHVKEHRLQADIRPGDRLLYYTSCGWMMWNWMVSALASEATLVLYDGSPVYPSHARLLDIVADDKVTHLGASAAYFASCAKQDVRPVADISSLRTIFSTGSALTPETFDYIYASWKHDVCLASLSGGTDIIGCFVGASPISPVWRGECQKRHLGMDVHVHDEAGDAVVGTRGELVCTAPHPSMPIGFWNDPDDQRYLATYFSADRAVWRHGDYVALSEHGGMQFYGRSDTVLNPSGVRIGTAEIYAHVLTLDEVVDAVAVGQKYRSDERIVLFVRLRETGTLTEQLIRRIKDRIRTGASPRHVPALIAEVADIPVTRSGKIAESAVRDVVNGRAVANIGALANPQSLSLFTALAHAGPTP